MDIKKLSQAVLEKAFCFKITHKNGNFACGEDTLALRLPSELADLRAGYANPFPLRFAYGSGFFLRVPQKRGLLAAPFSVAPATGIEPITNP